MGVDGGLEGRAEKRWRDTVDGRAGEAFFSNAVLADGFGY